MKYALIASGISLALLSSGCYTKANAFDKDELLLNLVAAVGYQAAMDKCETKVFTQKVVDEQIRASIMGAGGALDGMDERIHNIVETDAINFEVAHLNTFPDRYQFCAKMIRAYFGFKQ